MISIIHPSRSRPQKAKACRDHWLIRMSCDAREYIVALDESDPKFSEYEEIFHPSETFVSDSMNIVQAVNNAAKVCLGDIIIVISDDFECFENWDLRIREALKGKSGVLKTWDGIQKRTVTLPIITRDYYLQRGYIYHPDFKHSWADTFLTDEAEALGKLVRRMDITFHHMHPEVTKEPKDELYRRNDLTHDRDRHIYQKRKSLNFGL